MHRPSRTSSWWTALPEPGGLDVELKVLLNDASRQVVRDAADHDLPGRSVHYYDTADLALARRGVVVRLRAVGDDRGDVTVKLRRAAPVRLPKALRRHAGLTVEIDTLPADRHWSAALRRDLPPDLLADVLAGRLPLHRVLDRAQRRLYAARSGRRPELSRLRPVGPVRIRRCRLATLDCGSRVVAETCRYPDGRRLVEVSAKCPSEQAARAAAEFTALLRELHVHTAPDQHTKTRAALEILTRTV